MLVEDDWVKADGTTLGADNGLGVAAIMAVLSSIDIPHPEIEALFTIDEETGMTGAMGLKGGLLKGGACAHVFVFAHACACMTLHALFSNPPKWNRPMRVARERVP